MPTTFAIVVGLFLVGSLLLVFVVTTWNTVVALQRRVERAWANVDVALRQRWDELPNLVAAVRGQLGFEQAILEEVVRLRAAYSHTSPLAEQAQISDATSAAVRSLFGVVEAYPDLKSQANVLDLQDEIERLETLIAQRRELFNDQVFQYNATIGQLPALLLTRIMGWKPLPSFQADDEARARPDAALLALGASARPESTATPQQQ